VSAAEVRLGRAAGDSLGVLSATNEYTGPTFKFIKCVPVASFASQRRRQGRVTNRTPFVFAELRSENFFEFQNSRFFITEKGLKAATTAYIPKLDMPR
jgi:hypothetical protein